MARPLSVALGIFFIACMAFWISPCTASPPAGTGFSKPLQLTSDPHYDRNPSLLLGEDGTYWLFFTRGLDPRGVRGLPVGDPYNPDSDFYHIWYKQSRSLEGLKGAPEAEIPLEPPVEAWSAQRDVAALQDTDGKIWVFSSPGYGPEGGTDRGILAYVYDGSWTGPTIIRPGTYDGCGIGHIDALRFQERLVVIYDDCYTLKATSLDPASGWSSPVTIAGKATLGKAVEVDGTLYVTWVFLDAEANQWGPGIYLSSSSDRTTWTQTSDPIAAWGSGLTNWDPVLVKDRDLFRLFWAPSDTEQFIAVTSSRTPMDPGSWSAPVRVTRASYGTNSWWDFWPEPVTKGRNGGGTLALLYTSERNQDGTRMADGNIWLEVTLPRSMA
jgi:hypothetical protein